MKPQGRSGICQQRPCALLGVDPAERADVNLEGTGIDPAAMQRYVEEQIYSLPGTDSHHDEFTILLTGSRGVGTYTPDSDVDIDVLCPKKTYDAVHAASRQAGIIKSPTSFFKVLTDEDWDRYFGKQFSRPHFSITPLQTVEKQIAGYEDVPLWICTRARVLSDPGEQFRRIVDTFDGYPQAVLIKKIKYRWMLAAYWEVEVYPHHHEDDSELLAAAVSILNAVNELLRVFFLVDRKPFPYAKRLMRYADSTKLGTQFVAMLRRVCDLAVGASTETKSPWDRLDRASDLLTNSAECEQLEKACFQGMIDAGVDPDWVEADFGNIDELLTGQLGPAP